MMKTAIIIFDVVLLLVFLLVINFLFTRTTLTFPESTVTRRWTVQSIDTMKYSRDLAREKLKDADFDRVIDEQVSEIAETGATHVAVGTPYDAEFVPYLQRWVQAARKYDLNVWFRGNVSGWEEWFEYPKITPEEHTSEVVDFIKSNPDLFEDGDVFTSCSECENGAMGDPRQTGDVEGYRKFLVNEYIFTKDAFRDIKKDVASNYYSMNGDVARLVMDRKTTASLDGLVVVDHYVDSPAALASDIEEIAALSGGEVVLGEFGAPIPDIHGAMDEEQQASWLNDAYSSLSEVDSLVGVNYWVGRGGSTALVNESGRKLSSYGVVKNYYQLVLVTGTVVDETGRPIEGVEIVGENVYSKSNRKGHFQFPFGSASQDVTFSAKGYTKLVLDIDSYDVSKPVVMDKESKSFVFRVRQIVFNFLQRHLPY